MFELDEIMRQTESKMFAEILNRLREGKHTSSDLQKLKERCVEKSNCPREAPRLFVYKCLNLLLIINTQLKPKIALAELKEKIIRQIPYVH